jgi:phenylacetate-CoA ligase
MNYGSKLQRSIYYGMPQSAKSLLTSVYGLRQRYCRYRRHYRNAVVLLQESQYWDESRLSAFEQDQVLLFLDHSVRTSPYYQEREIYKKVTRLSELPLLPELTKEAIRKDSESFYCRDLKQLDPTWAHTSGTTGQALKFPVSSSCYQREYAFRATHYSWAGYTYESREPMLVCQGHPVAHHDRMNPPFWTRDLINNMLFMSSYHLSDRTFHFYAQEMDRFSPTIANGYPSSMYLLAIAYLKYGSGRLRMNAVYTTSETLFSHQRKTIERAFGCSVFDWYGNSEMCGNIVECERGERHLKREHSFLEVVDGEGTPVPPGGTGRLLCTGFGNWAFPLVRYSIGDVVKLARNQTSVCGRSGVLIDKVLGRMEDYVMTSDGRLVGRLDHLFKDSLNVIEAQIVQRVPGAVTLRIVPGEHFGVRDERQIRDEAALRLGSSTEVVFERVSHIPRGPTGKFPFIISSLDVRNLWKESDLSQEEWAS